MKRRSRSRFQGGVGGESTRTGRWRRKPWWMQVQSGKPPNKPSVTGGGGGVVNHFSSSSWFLSASPAPPSIRLASLSQWTQCSRGQFLSFFGFLPPGHLSLSLWGIASISSPGAKSPAFTRPINGFISLLTMNSLWFRHIRPQWKFNSIWNEFISGGDGGSPIINASPA